MQFTWGRWFFGSFMTCITKVQYTSKKWHTILFVPYGRGGKDFVLDITDTKKPFAFIFCIK